MTKTMFQYYLKHPELDWTCVFCALPKLDDAFFVDKSIEDIFSVICTESEELPHQVSFPRSGIRSILAIGHVNVNCILGKIDEVLDLLAICLFDILFISETKIDKSVPSSLLSSPHYRIIRRERKHGAGGLLTLYSYFSNRSSPI